MATESSDDASCILGCLAMIGDEKSKNALHELKINPKPWRKKLYVDTDVYAEEGGWTFNEENEYIKLNYDRCFSFEPGDKKDENGTFIARKRGDKCKHCGCEWTFNEENEYIKLNYDRCFSFEPGDKKDENGTFIARKRGDKCKHCGCELVDILVIDGKDKRFEF